MWNKIKKFFKPTFTKRVLFFVFTDMIIFTLSFYLSYQLRFNFRVPPQFMASFYHLVLFNVSLKILFMYIFKLYHTSWRFFGLGEIKNLIKAIFSSEIIFTIFLLLFYQGFFARSIAIIDLILSLLFAGAFRISKRFFIEHQKDKIPVKPTILIGANQKAFNIIKSYFAKEIEYKPVAIVEDEEKMIGTYISNIKVEDIKNLEEIIKKKGIQNAIIAKNYSPKELDELFEKLKELNIKNIKIAKLLGDKKEKLQDISIEDLLARKPKDLDTKKIEEFIKNKSVLITGAGGSIGSEIVRQCVKYKAKKIILVDNSEFNLYKITEEIKDYPLIPLMISVTDKELLEKCFLKYKPQIVIHAAAYKHVHLVESNVEPAIKNNIIGTKNCIDLAVKYKTEKFVLISTDKAVRPTNVMGATKRVCELYAQNTKSKECEIVSVRFGNVLGSSGSVIPKFKKQIENNEPITVTHPEITRYFMLIPEACQLVLQAAAIAKENEIFILDMGNPVKIADLAKKMLKIYAKEHLPIKYIGLRPGEKLYEELLIDESDKKTIYESIFVAKPTPYDIEKLNKDIEELLKTKDKIKKLKEIVPEFNHNANPKREI